MFKPIDVLSESESDGIPGEIKAFKALILTRELFLLF